MNLVEKLIRMDKSEFTKRETKKIKSKRLSKLLGEDTEITIQAVSGKRATDIMTMCMDRNGNKDYYRKPGKQAGCPAKRNGAQLYSGEQSGIVCGNTHNENNRRPYPGPYTG